MYFEGNILKMKTELGKVVSYKLPIGDQLLDMNSLLGKKITLSFEGIINCIATGDKIKKSYNQGYSYKSFASLASCDICIVKPELCHYAKGTCREPEWGEANCLKPHVVYLSLTSHLKIGITRASQVPTRWIDQGAIKAIPILNVKDRLTSGLIETEIKKDISDVTNWRKMLKGDIEDVDLAYRRDEIYENFGELIDDLDADDVNQDVIEINYPILELPEKVTSLSFDKRPLIEGTLMGIKGQYLILDTGVLNMRKHQGYYLKITQ
jgi:hypothetical protein